MDLHEFENIKSKIEKLKTEQARTEGELKAAKDRLEREFGFKNISEADEALKQLNDQIKTEKSKLNTFLEQLENITDWENL